jgi:hypothetical protein
LIGADMDAESEIRLLREGIAAARDRIDRLRTNRPAMVRKVVGQVIDQGAIPTQPGPFFSFQRADPLGPPNEGDPINLTPYEKEIFYADVLYKKAPKVNDYLLCTRMRDRWVAHVPDKHKSQGCGGRICIDYQNDCGGPVLAGPLCTVTLDGEPFDVEYTITYQDEWGLVVPVKACFPITDTGTYELDAVGAGGNIGIGGVPIWTPPVATIEVTDRCKEYYYRFTLTQQPVPFLFITVFCAPVGGCAPVAYATSVVAVINPGNIIVNPTPNFGIVGAMVPLPGYGTYTITFIGPGYQPIAPRTFTVDHCNYLASYTATSNPIVATPILPCGALQQGQPGFVFCP